MARKKKKTSNAARQLFNELLCGEQHVPFTLEGVKAFPCETHGIHLTHSGLKSTLNFLGIPMGVASNALPQPVAYGEALRRLQLPDFEHGLEAVERNITTMFEAVCKDMNGAGSGKGQLRHYCVKHDMNHGFSPDNIAELDMLIEDVARTLFAGEVQRKSLVKGFTSYALYLAHTHHERNLPEPVNNPQHPPTAANKDKHLMFPAAHVPDDILIEFYACKRKRAHVSEAAALQFIQENILDDEEKELLTVYACGYCTSYHYGHTSQRTHATPEQERTHRLKKARGLWRARPEAANQFIFQIMNGEL